MSRWSIEKLPDLIGKCDSACHLDGFMVPAQMIDFGRRGKTKACFGVFADKRISKCLTDEQIKAMPLWHYQFIDPGGEEIRYCKLWIEL